ncbi:ubiquinol-cytochrome c reductase subunit 6 [Cladophialophora psammophila CBS 110553]|uniref:Cytochrome b-c1 complex subunit 6, mitochondrial n=1 Tax=Cladophialophora psammophila CBS 110553 TaxID=1182543 RepID=W9WS59_9EURO|nr:ubiquinol-cytochrome c reductase subunit 6 [Cladophialophora psammophila CBS 110553]EXJ70773.1 ubiquinol-cytochrome c reductase subunit 6 [Cladophialophora psammophila CBS 110553]
MGIADFFSDLLSSVSFVQEVQAEAPADDNEQSSEGSEGSNEEEEGTEDTKEGEEEGGEDGDEEEEEEEEEPVDPKPKLEEDCARSAQCVGYKHHFDECVERVTQQEEDPDHKGPKENCVEEFFHLQHCATQCAAPKLFKQLK